MTATPLRRGPGRVLGRGLVAVVAATLLLAGAGPASASPVLERVVPGNGASVQRTPDQVVLTFSRRLDETVVAVTLTTPEGQDEVTPRVDGRSVSVSVPDDGPGEYLVSYRLTPGPAEGETVFTVLAPGESAPAEQRASIWWFVTGAGLLVLLVLVLVRTLRGLRRE
ncbi:copper resistance CopC family protein [Thalassiella azotivora]